MLLISLITQAFSSVTIPPIIKKVVRNGRTLVYRVQDTSLDQETPFASESAPNPQPAIPKSKNLVRRVSSDTRSYPSMIDHQLEDVHDDDIQGKYLSQCYYRDNCDSTSITTQM